MTRITSKWQGLDRKARGWSVSCGLAMLVLVSGAAALVASAGTGAVMMCLMNVGFVVFLVSIMAFVAFTLAYFG